MPIFGFVGQRSDRRIGETRPPRLAQVETFFGSYRDGVPDFVDVLGLSDVCARASRAGRVTIVNSGPENRGYRLCDWCGYGEPAPYRQKKQAKEPAHIDVRRPDRKCNGTLRPRHLGHEYLTDAVEIDIGIPMTLEEARSVLYALLQGATTLNIERSDLTGALSSGGVSQRPTIVILDAEPAVPATRSASASASRNCSRPLLLGWSVRVWCGDVLL